jgi:hypothetical protein
MSIRLSLRITLSPTYLMPILFTKKPTEHTHRVSQGHFTLDFYQVPKSEQFLPAPLMEVSVQLEVQSLIYHRLIQELV